MSNFDPNNAFKWYMIFMIVMVLSMVAIEIWG